MAKTSSDISLESSLGELRKFSVLEREHGDALGGRASAEDKSAARLRHLVRGLLFPWFVWSAVAWIAHGIANWIPGQRRSRVAACVAQLCLYAFFGFPLTVFLLGELLITANEALIGEQANYRLQSDFEVGLANTQFFLPGPILPVLPPATPVPTPEYRRYLTERYAPVIVQKLAHHPEWDIPVSLQYDGNTNPRDNVINEPIHRPHVAAVYGELTAETEDSYYLAYGLYHIKDYDHPLRELLTDWTYHDSDNEGLMIRVDKQTMRIAQVETWFHNRFLLYDETGVSTGTEPVHGAIHTESGTHLVVYSQPEGHGVRVFQNVDLDALRENVKILRLRGDRSVVPVVADRSVQYDATYDLVSFDYWYANALGPFGEKGEGDSLFEEYITIGNYPDGTPINIGRYIAGWDYSKNGWSRPKPPWSWDDGWDQLPIWVWHYLPSYAFSSHSGRKLSHDYIYNSPVEKTFGMTVEEIMPLIRGKIRVVLRRDQKWKGLEGRGGNLAHSTYWNAFNFQLKSYVNYVFHALG